MKKVLPRLITWIFPALLVLLSSTVILANHVPGTWLTGWDTLHPEFNFPLSFHRILNGVWRSDQGVGALAAHSHMSELPRLIILWFLSLVLPLHTVRYAFIGLCFLVGPIGMYFLARSLFGKRNSFLTVAASFLAGLFYIGNLGTVQHFYVVFEMFAVAYGFLPWLCLAALHYLHNGNRKALFAIGVAAFVSSSMAYASTLWFASITGVFLFLIGYAVVNKLPLIWRRLGIVVAVIVLANTYWLLPNLYYFVSSSGYGPADSKISQLFSPESFLQNKAYGTIADTLLLKNFLLSWQVFDFSTQKTVMLMESWKQHIEQFRWAGWLVAGATVFGAAASFWQQSRWRWALLLPTLFGISVLAINTPVIGAFFQWAREAFPFLKEALRTPFTKFSFVLMMAYALSLAAGWKVVAERWHRSLLGKWFSGLMFAGITSSILIWSAPLWRGELISQHIQLPIPQAYFQLFEFMRTQPHNARVAVLPLTGPFGWEYHEWGYQGAGFIWFGLPQSVLVRDFDRWSPYNETFYTQLHTHITTQDSPGIQRVLEQYRVEYLIFDSSATHNGTPLAQEEQTALKELLLESGAQHIWEENGLTVYTTTAAGATSLFTPTTFFPVQADTVKTRVDRVVQKEGTYAEIPGAAVSYPFSDSTKETLSGVFARENFWEFVRPVSPRSLVLVPPFEHGQALEVPATALYEDGYLTVEFAPSVIIQANSTPLVYQLPASSLAVPNNPNTITFSLNNRVESISETQKTQWFPVQVAVGEPIALHIFDATAAEDVSLDDAFRAAEVTPCWQWPGKQTHVTHALQENARSLSVMNGAACLSLYIESFSLEPSVGILTVPHRSDTKMRPQFCVNNAHDPQQTCLHPDVASESQTSADWAEVTRQFVVNPQEAYWLDLIAGPVTHSDQTESLSYQTPRLSLAPIIASTAWESSVWDTWLSSQHVRTDDTSLLRVHFSALPTEELTGYEQVPSTENCDVFGRGSAKTDGLTLWAKDSGAACASFPITGISTGQSGILAVHARNNSGRPLKMYLYNDAINENDIETLLPENNEPIFFSLLEWPNVSQGLTLFFENRSFGPEVSHNELLSTTVSPVPLTWLSSFQVVAENTSSTQPIANSLHIVRHQQYGPAYYVAETEGAGLLALDQGFDAGWVAFMNGTLLPHIRVNGWANGWLLTENGTVTLVYWPQYLEWAGLVVATATLLKLFFNLRKKL